MLKNSRIVTRFKPIVAFLFFIVICVLLVKELSTIDYKETIRLFRHLPTSSFILVIAAGIGAVLMLSLYDFTLQQTLNLRYPLNKVVIRSFIINSLNNLLGFGGLFGAGLRMFHYRSTAQDEKEVRRGISMLLLSSYTGLSLLSLILALGFLPDDVSRFLPFSKIIFFICALYVIAFLVYSFIRPLNRVRTAGITFVIVSLTDWLITLLLFNLILSVLHINVPFTALFALFVIAALSGLVSMMPGGIGAFDYVMILGLQGFGISEEKALLAVLLYRTVYYFFPLLISLLIASFEYKDTTKAYIEDNKIINNAIMTGAFLRAIQKETPYQLPAIILSLLTIITSLVYYFNHFLIIYDAFSNHHYRYYSFIIVFHVAASLVLLLNANGVMHGTMRALMMSMVSVVILLVTTALSYGTIVSYIWLSLLLILLILRYRKAPTVKRTLTPIKVFISIIIVTILLFINHVITIDILEIYTHSATKFDDQLLGLIVWCTVLVFILISAAITFYYSRKYNQLLVQQVDENTIKNIIETHGGSYVSHLALNGDKSFYVNEEQDAFLMYQQKFNACIIMGDPIGNEAQFSALLNQFYAQATFIGRDIIFYQVRPNHLPLYHDFGNSFFKIGEEALINLAHFTISGKKQRAFRATINKMEKEGYSFSIIHPPFDNHLFNELHQVSDAWLDGKHEMSFSVGSFNKHYLEQAPVAIIKNSAEQIVAFSSLMPTYYNNTLSVDLIRWLPDADIAAMDALYLHMLLYAQEQNYDYFNMGMATLSNVGQNKYGYLREKIAGHVFNHFNSLYSFEGLRKYKQKYNPEWGSRFIIYRKYTSLSWCLLRIALVINRPPKTSFKDEGQEY